ncbi:MAG: helix-turn-helix domain-containing protein [Candidatus Dojkabacteria bacterium]
MKPPSYNSLLSTSRWKTIIKETIETLKYESCSLVSAPFGGRRFFLRCVEESYLQSEEVESIVIRFQINPRRNTVEEVNEKLCDELRASHSEALLQSEDSRILMKSIAREGKRVLIIIDMFENAAGASQLLDFLESLRSIDPHNIRFLLAPGLDFVTKPANYQTQGSLVTNNLVVLPTLTKQETEAFIKNNSKLYGWQIPTKHYSRIFSLSGGNPGFIKYICKSPHVHKTSLKIQDLCGDPGIYLKLQELYEILSEANLISNSKPNVQYKDILGKIGITAASGEQKMKLLKYFLEHKTPDRIAGMNLSVQEDRVFQLFSERIEEIVTLDEISTSIWGEHASTKYTLWGIYKLISNINKKISGSKLYIKNSRGRGYYLTKHNSNES